MRIFYGFLPWIVIWTWGNGPHFPAAALLSWMLTMVWHLPRILKRRAKVIEIGTCLYFTCLGILAQTPCHDFLLQHCTPLGNAVLGTIALVSILMGDPFIVQYGRERVPQEKWTDPTFLRVTRELSWLWVVTLYGMAVSQELVGLAPAHAVFLRWELPYGWLLLSVVFSLMYPKYVRARKRMLEAAATAAT